VTLVPASYADLSRAIAIQLAVFPRHERYLTTRFASSDEADLAISEEIAGLILKTATPSIETACEDYRWLTHALLEGEMYFRRHGKYLLSTTSETMDRVYSDEPSMRRYMNGLLMSHLWWQNHIDALKVFRDVFIAGNKQDFSHLEVGPGHGLFLHLAVGDARCARAEGWDISPGAIAATRASLERLGTSRNATLHLSNLFAAHDCSFDSIGCSDVLGVLENPSAALEKLSGLLAPGGRLFISAPVNAPAPDQIYVFSTPEKVIEMIESAGLKIIHRHFASATGATLERARRQALTISAIVIATTQN
jgi:SAM-dependent methyltransferase